MICPHTCPHGLSTITAFYRPLLFVSLCDATSMSPAFPTTYSHPVTPYSFPSDCTVLPWAQGVGRSNRPAPTIVNHSFIGNAGFRPGLCTYRTWRWWGGALRLPAATTWTTSREFSGSALGKSRWSISAVSFGPRSVIDTMRGLRPVHPARITPHGSS